jgi:hypothetical protein
MGGSKRCFMDCSQKSTRLVKTGFKDCCKGNCYKVIIVIVVLFVVIFFIDDMVVIGIIAVMVIMTIVAIIIK